MKYRIESEFTFQQIVDLDHALLATIQRYNDIVNACTMPELKSGAAKSAARLGELYDKIFSSLECK